MPDEDSEPAELTSPPPRSHRPLLRLSVAAGIVAVVGTTAVAAVAAAVVAFGLARSAAPPASGPVYRTAPGPCSLVTPATLARYVAGAPRSVRTSVAAGSRLTVGCEWSGFSGGDARMMGVQITLFRSSAAVADASRYFAVDPKVSCSCTLTSQPVGGLGDQARELLLTPDSAPGPSAQGRPAVILMVRSGNAVLFFSVAALSYRPVPPGWPPTPAAELAGLTAAAHDALAALARPAIPQATVAAAGTVSQQYPLPAHVCALVPAAVLARYLPDAQPLPPAPGDSGATYQSGASYQGNGCDWDQNSGLTLMTVTVDHYATSATGIAAAQVDFTTLAHDLTQSVSISGLRAVITGSRPVTGVGDQAIAIGQKRTTVSTGTVNYLGTLLVWSGNILLNVTFTYDLTDQWPYVPPPPDQTAELTDLTGIARGVLTAIRP